SRWRALKTRPMPPVPNSSSRSYRPRSPGAGGPAPPIRAAEVLDQAGQTPALRLTQGFRAVRPPQLGDEQVREIIQAVQGEQAGVTRPDVRGDRLQRLDGQVADVERRQVRATRAGRGTVVLAVGNHSPFLGPHPGWLGDWVAGQRRCPLNQLPTQPPNYL